MAFASAQRGECVSTLAVRPDHLQQTGVVHAGVLTTRADHTAGGAAASTLPAGAFPLTTNLALSLLRPGRTAALRCVGRVIRSGRSVVPAEAEVCRRRRCAGVAGHGAGHLRGGDAAGSVTMSTTAATIVDFARFAPADLYRLFADVYASADGMSETLAEKYPSLSDFEADLGLLRRLPGAVALAAAVAQDPVAYVIMRPRKQSRLRHTADLSMGVANCARGRGLVRGAARGTGAAGHRAGDRLPDGAVGHAAAMWKYRARRLRGTGCARARHADRRPPFDGVLMRRFLRR
jgi:uncharacterized protein (TIGR00369 family)